MRVTQTSPPDANGDTGEKMRVTTKKPAWRAIVGDGARARSIDKRCGYFLY